VRIDHVRLEPLGRAAHLPREPQMPALASAPPRRDDTFDLVPPCGKSPLDPLDECAEVGIVGPGVHLRDEQDPHAERSLPRRPRAREVLQASRAHGRSLGLRPVRGCALSRLTSNALPDRPDHGYAPALLGLLRRRLSATVLLPCSGDPFPAVLATIFRVVILHVFLLSFSVSSPHRDRRRGRNYMRLPKKGITKTRLVFSSRFFSRDAATILLHLGSMRPYG